MSGILVELYQSKLVDNITRICGAILHGTITLKLPNGKKHNFSGKFHGPDADLDIKDWSVINNYMAKGDIGFGEDYINGLWETANLPNLITLITLNELTFGQYFRGNFFYKIINQLQHMLKFNSEGGSSRNIAYHYSLNNDFYRLWLDKSMTYSSALFGGNKDLSLEEAQQAKYNRIIDKLAIKPEESVLDIGCGWGALTEYLARKNINVTAITLSEPQAKFADQRIINAGLQHRASIKLLDYRNITGIFDYIISLGMFEHVGRNYWAVYFNRIASHLKQGGKAMIQTIVIDEKLFKASKNTSGFIQHYIFPGGFLPSHNSFINEASKAGLTCTESFAFGQDYAITLKHWLARFDSQLPQITKLGLTEQFIRRWRFYLALSRAGFLSSRVM